jgi:multicopper oxidase
MIDRRCFLVLSAMGAAAGAVGACSPRAAEPAVAEEAGAEGKAVEVALNPAETGLLEFAGLVVGTAFLGIALRRA